MFNFRYKIIFLISAIFVLSGLFFVLPAFSQTSQNVNVIMTVPDSGTTPPPVDNLPTISSVSTSTSYATVIVGWSASDDVGISTSSFVYGLDTSYGSSGSITGSYQIFLSSLTTDTIYYFRISVTDTGSHTTQYAGYFKTLSLISLPDATPPVISSIQVVVGITTTTINWATNEQADGQVNYGLTNAYGSTVNDSNLSLSHNLLLFNLLPNTTYHYRIISTDGSSNSGSTNDAVFTTAKDNTAPPNVSNLSLTTTTNSIITNWVNPSLVTVPDFSGVKVLRKIGFQSANFNDGTTIYTGGGQTYTDTNVIVGTTYFYTVFSYDTSNNYSTGIYISGNLASSIIPPVTNEICNNNIDDDSDGSIDCNDPDCGNAVNCQIQPQAENCSNGIDDDGDGLVDCDDNDCVNISSCKTTPPSPKIENCSNGIDDDGDGLVDCSDSDCFGFSGCSSEPLVGGSTPACQDRVDNDDDGLIDYPNDPGCDNASDSDEYNPKLSTVPGFAKLDINSVSFLAGNNQIILIPINSIVRSLAGSGLTVLVNKGKLPSQPVSIVFKIDGKDQHQLILNSSTGNYYTNLSFPNVGEHQAYLEIDYGASQFDSIAFKLIGEELGDVFDDQGKRLDGVEIILYDKNGLMLKMEQYNQINPIKTNVNGSFGWLVPNGQYYLKARKDGYYDRVTPVFSVLNHVINSKINLIVKPIKLTEVSVKGVTQFLTSQTKAISKLTVQKVEDISHAVQQVADNPDIEKVTERIVAPATIGVVAIAITPFLTWADILPLLRLLFLQPLMLLGWRRRKKWGVVYNALNKLPVDLAIIRLINHKTGKLVQSKVTDKLGRYVFIADPGQYCIEARKSNLIFPSVLLANFIKDGHKIDIYHGETINVTEKRAIITANVPMDPVGDYKKPKRLVWQRVSRA